jgi:hypothetical protein
MLVIDMLCAAIRFPQVSVSEIYYKNIIPPGGINWMMNYNNLEAISVSFKCKSEFIVVHGEK